MKVTSNIQYSLNVFPVSFPSMIENSLDPSHEITIYFIFINQFIFINWCYPITDYSIVGDSSDEGFILQHTPCQGTEEGGEESPKATTREYIAPYSNTAKQPWFNTTWHFVPSKPGTTLVYTGGIMLKATTAGSRSSCTICSTICTTMNTQLYMYKSL
jgi:hypothetical protein